MRCITVPEKILKKLERLSSKYKFLIGDQKCCVLETYLFLNYIKTLVRLELEGPKWKDYRVKASAETNAAIIIESQEIFFPNWRKATGRGSMSIFSSGT